MKTHCNQKTFDFQTQNSRKIAAHFNGGNIASDAGVALPAIPNTKKRLKIRICEKSGLDAAFSSKVDKIANKLYEDLKKIERDCPDPEEAIRFIRHFIESELQDAEEGIICCEQSERDSMKPANPKDPNQVLGSAVGIMAFGQIIADQRRRKRAMEAMLKEINNISKQNIEISQVVAKLCKIAQFYLSK